MRRVEPQEVLEHHLVVAGDHPLVWGGWHQLPKKRQQMWGSQPRLMCLPSKMLLPLKIIKRGLKLIPASTHVFCTAAFSHVRVNATTFAFARRQKWAHPTHVLLVITVLSWGVGADDVLVAMGVKWYSAMEASHLAALLLTNVARAGQQPLLFRGFLCFLCRHVD